MLRKILISMLLLSVGVFLRNTVKCFSEIVYTSHYPLAQNATYVKAVNLGAGWEQYNATDPTKSLTAGNSGNSWGGASGDRSQRFHIDLGTAMKIKRVMYVNASGGGSTDSNSTGIGVKNFTLWGSNTASAFNDGVFSHDTFWVQLTTSQATFDRHPVVNYFPLYNNTPTISYILVTGAASYRYYAFKFSDNWYSANYQCVRRIELQTDNVPDAASSLPKYIKKKKGVVFIN